MNGSEWDNPLLAEEYADKLEHQVDWYEHEVNVPSLLSLLPRKTKTILDFGSGPGQFTAQLATTYHVEGADRSPAMIDIAANRYPGVTFHQWDGQSAFPGDQKFDALLSKLTVHFVEDLHVFARFCHQVLSPHGCVVLSVQHPLRAMKKVEGNYLRTTAYQGGSNKYGLYYQMIHRSFEDYIQPFLENGFTMTGLLEPKVPKALAKKHKVSEEDMYVPKRLNLRFERSSLA